MPPFPTAGVLILSHITVDARGATDAEDVVAAGMYDGVIRNAPPALVGDLLFGEVGRIVMIASDEQDPVVCFPEPAGNLVIDSLVIPRFLEAEPTVTGNDKNGVFQAILYAQFEDNSLEIPVNIPGDDDLFGIWIFK